MNRVTAVAATLATAAAATMAAATIGPAMAAPRSTAAHPVAHAKTTAKRASTTAAKAARQAKLPGFLPTQIASELDGGKYVTVVTCQGVDSPPPIHLAKSGTPLTVSGGGPSAAIFKMLKQADPYKNVYTCTVIVKEKVPGKPSAAVTKKIVAHKVRGGCEFAPGGGTRCTKKVTLNTGFGGLAPQVKHHYPAG